jgi:hypothetical protein
MSTAHLATLKAVFKDGSSPTVSRPTQQPLELPQFAAGHIWIECVNEDGSAHSLAYDTILLGVRRHPTDAEPAISVQASNMDVDPDGEAADNWARVELVPGHWTDVDPKLYGYDVVALVGGDPDDRVVVVPHSQWKTTAAAVHPGDDISVPESQQPLAQGLQGEQGPAGPQGATGPQGPAGDPATLSDDNPQAAGTADPGVSEEASRADHVHPAELPSQAGHSGKFLTTDGTDVSWGTVAGGGGQADSLLVDGVHGDLQIAANIQGAASTANQFVKYTVAESGAPPWAQYVVQYDNEYGSRKNQVMSFGWNVQPSGRVDETKAAFATVLESHYEPNNFTHQAEWYLAVTRADGTSHRPLAVDAPTDAAPLVRIAGQSLVLQDPDTLTTRWSWGLNAGAGGACTVVPPADLSAIFHVQRNNIPLFTQYNASGSPTTLITFDSANDLRIGPPLRAAGGLKADGTTYFRDVTGASVLAQTGFSGGVWSISSAIADISIVNGSSQVYVSPGAGTQLLYGSNRLFVGSVDVEAKVNNASAGRIKMTFGSTTEWTFGDGAGSKALIPNSAHDIGTSAKPIGTLFANKIRNADAANQVTTVGSAGGATALPATPTGYLVFRLADGTEKQIPYYDKA